MVHKAQHLGSTRENQMARKKQILDELQKVGLMLLDRVPPASARPTLPDASVSTLNHPLTPRVLAHPVPRADILRVQSLLRLISFLSEKEN